jgi:2-amino-4-hydroxy-6-hydroxymethyldihydropteridine diphosphokinase
LTSTVTYLGLGSNIGEREVMLRSALDALNGPDLRLLRVSSLYETEPVGLREQPWFLNLVAEFETELVPLDLLHRTQSVERALGRQRSVPNGPRSIDIDILLYGDVVMKTAELEIPHPRYAERRFTLAPFVELNPELLDPSTGRPMASMLDALEGQRVRRRNLQYPATPHDPGTKTPD